MKVSISKLAVEMELKNKETCFDIYDNQGAPLGKLLINRGYLSWRKPNHRKVNDKRITWEDFIEYMEARRK